MLNKTKDLKVIWITGASSGIGKSLSVFYARPGVTLGLVARNEALLSVVADECRGKGSIVYTYVVDVTDDKLLKFSIDDFQDKVGVVDLVIANAGIRLEDNDIEYASTSREVMSVNFLGVVNTFMPFVPRMQKNKHGKIFAISSIASFRSTQNSGIYSASKAAVNLWTESLRLRLKNDSIVVCNLCSGFVKTAMTEGLPFWMPGILNVEDAVQIIHKYIERNKRCVIFPWQSRLIWGMFRVMPGSIYDKLMVFMKKRHVKK